nr:winged helix-turn-helix transcriptional regulator [Blautia sp. XA-2221]
MAGYGLVYRKLYAEVSPRVEYRLLEVGNSLMPILQLFCM